MPSSVLSVLQIVFEPGDVSSFQSCGFVAQSYFSFCIAIAGDKCETAIGSTSLCYDFRAVVTIGGKDANERWYSHDCYSRGFNWCSAHFTHLFSRLFIFRVT